MNIIPKPIEYRIRAAEPVIEKEDIEVVSQALREKRLSSGKYVQEFEKAFASYIGVKEAISVNSGTAALHIALKALGIGPGDEVITTSFTFAATANVIVLLGAKPVFVDIEFDTYNLDPDAIEKAVTPRTKVIMPIHYGGQCAEMDDINAIARDHHLYVVEDAAPAAGAIYRGKRAGALGEVGCFSFFPDKNITTGEGGMITTNNHKVARRSRLLRNHGASARYYHVDIGWNYRMTDLAAALGLVQLRRLDSIIERKNIIAKEYGTHLSSIGDVKPPVVREYNRHTFMLYSIMLKTHEAREKIRNSLQASGIETRICFPPVHLQPVYVNLFRFRAGTLPITEATSHRILSLPMSYYLSEVQIREIVEIIKRHLNE